MKALLLEHFGSPPAVVTVPRPVPAAGQVLIRVLAAGLCHTDLGLMTRDPADFRWPLPFALGHEVVGEVVELGAGVTSVGLGEQVAVYGAAGCGRCDRCRSGAENYCDEVEAAGVRRLGLGGAGGVAEFVLVDHPRQLVPLDGLDPVAAVGLTDAGLTSYHAIEAERDLLGPGSTALVIGAGGLGHVAIQILRATTSATVVVSELDAQKRELAARVGAHHVLRGEGDAQSELHEVIGGSRVDVVLDFVGSDATLELARRVVRRGGSISMVGAGGGRLAFAHGLVPFGVRASAPFWGTLPDLRAVLDLARSGRVAVHTRTYRLDDVVEAYRDLDDGRVLGRAVVVP